MSKKPRAALFGSRRVSKSQVREALLARVRQRVAASGTWKLPAVPALLDAYVTTCGELFASAGRHFDARELEAARGLIDDALKQAHSASQRSKIAIKFQAEAAQPLGFEVTSEASSIAETYTRWVDSDDAPLFGAHADARALDLAAELGDPRSARILDIGAGTGRNTLALARKGHPVDAVELTPKFVESLSREAALEELTVRAIQSDIFAETSELLRYRMVLVSEVVSDFRGLRDLRRLFELAARVLEDEGVLVLNLHMAAHGYTPERAAREFAEQCYSTLYTASDVAQAAAGLPFACVANDSVHEYERAHLPGEAWPPTPWFENWVLGLDVYELSRGESPVELRWLVFRKRAPAEVSIVAQRTRLLRPELLRDALLRRLKRRAVGSGMLILPALPALVAEYAAMCFRLFGALERDFVAEQRGQVEKLLTDALEQAFALSPRSNIVVRYEAPMGTELALNVAADAVPIADAYAEWFEAAGDSLFGVQPDARVMALSKQLSGPEHGAILDLGAGLGRNALALGRAGYRVDAVDLAPVFVERLRDDVARDALPVRVLLGDLFDTDTLPNAEYQLVLGAGLVGDLRSTVELRRLFELAASWLRPSGLLLLSVHVARVDEVPDDLARQWGQQCCAMFFTRSELACATDGLLTLVADDSAYAFERENLPEGAFPVTPAFPEWALGLHMYALEPDDCPIELRWLLFKKPS
ncbi:MAG: class I SAM-dependent methyltransferase [Myxococcota bacterium]